MTPRTVSIVLASVAVISAAAPVDAHPLNVYVQASEIDLTSGVVTLELRLTPGVNVAAQLIAAMDLNHDDAISAAEQAAYAERVRGDVSLAVDGRTLSLQLTSSSFAAIEQMRQGLGDIVLAYRAEAPYATRGTHVVTFENRHERAIAAYLVNALQPSDAGVRIVAQRRAYDQSTYRLDFAVGEAPAAATPRAVTSVWGWLDRSAALSVIATFVLHGVRHILTGYDHLLFLGALVLAAVTLWDLIKVVTAFTLAHSLTLTLAALDLVYVPDRFVEPIIAGSIVFVAAQNVFWPERARGRTRLIVAFLFGLFHGLGFAGGLLEVMHQMPTATIALAILGFSIGVELGNQLVLLPLFGATTVLRRAQSRLHSRPELSAAVRRFASAAISMAGLYYLGVALAGLG